ncbi:SUKH-3 domain-containing protein [Rugosimonospora africana]|uniref:SUKH-3 immunity protein n=1 Tax=Rugosimonospora africana TaxID=556532 RepID=A0A8J3QNC1_9ACTN|nr:SUKH-3 domain-containing protein [Rugosimonospora africana]GIH14084.1 hypothetical protein Raf01_22560 [Rugosimonospora africana]
MVTAEQATELARPWALASLPASRGAVGLYEFELGFVVWPLPPPAPPRDGPPATIGAPRLVIDKETGEQSIWPSLSAEAIAERYRVERRAGQRFTAEVREVLSGAGWQPGRDVSAWVSQWLAKVYEEHPDAGRRLPMFPAARAALAEFGGLRFTQLSRVGYAGGGFRVEVWPDVGRVLVDLFAEFAADIRVPVFPFLWYEDGPSDAVVDENGRVFLLHPAGEFLVADSVDEAVTAFVRGPELRAVDDHGEVIGGQ